MSKLMAALPAAVFLLISGCSGGDTPPNPYRPFYVELGGKSYSGTTQRLLVPFSGAEYDLNIKTDDDITWRVDVDGVTPDGFLEVTPVGNGKGSKTITVTAAANGRKQRGHTGTITVTNTVKNSVTKFVFDQNEKEVHIPDGAVYQTAADFYNRESKFNVYCMAEGPNVAILYDKAWGADPISDPSLPLDLDKCVERAETIYAWLVDEAGFANWTTSYAAMYKLLIFVHYSNDGGAVGYGKENVGITEVKQPGITEVNKYGMSNLMLHEMAHCFQYITAYDGAYSYGGSGPIYEMTSQWALLKKFPDWPDLEYSHFKDFMKNTHKAFLHEDNQYHSPYVLAFWDYKHPGMVARLWQGNIESDNRDPVQTYKRMNGLTQSEFNDEMFEGVCRFVTWDMPEIRDANIRHIDKHQYMLQEVSSTRFQAHPETCPQNYGYNCIKLKAPTAGTTVTVEFNGNTSLSGYKVKNSEYQGWRYGFVAMKANGERIYGDMNQKQTKRVSFTVPEGGIRYLWFVVMGAPTTHWKHVKSSGTTDNNNNWPYEITLNGTTLDTPASL